jgi:hypothetical protein
MSRHAKGSRHGTSPSHCRESAHGPVTEPDYNPMRPRLNIGGFFSRNEQKCL